MKLTCATYERKTVLLQSVRGADTYIRFHLGHIQALAFKIMQIKQKMAGPYLVIILSTSVVCLVCLSQFTKETESRVQGTGLLKSIHNWVLSMVASSPFTQ